MPKVTVIIPTHNRAQLLEKAIQSVLNQTYTDFEVLVCDDASTDNTWQIVESFSDKRIRFVRYQKNIGVISVRNIAIVDSRGDYIALLDDDDEWLPPKLEKQLELLEGSSTKLGAVYTGAYSIDMELGKMIYIRIPEFRGNILQGLLFEDFITNSSIVLKKSCFERVGLFDPEYKSASDFDMWIRIAKDYEFDYVNDLLVKHRIQQCSISHNHHNVIMGLERLMMKHYNLFKCYNRAYANHQFNIGVAYCYVNNIKEGRRAFLRSIYKYPYEIKVYYNLFLSFFGIHAYKIIKSAKKKIILKFGSINTNTGKITIMASIFKKKRHPNLDRLDVQD